MRRDSFPPPFTCSLVAYARTLDWTITKHPSMAQKAKEAQQAPASASAGNTDAPASSEPADEENVFCVSSRSYALGFPRTPSRPAVDVYVVGDLETRNDGVQSAHPRQRGVAWGTRALAIALLVVGAIQWSYASDLRSKVGHSSGPGTVWARYKLDNRVGRFLLLTIDYRAFWATSNTSTCSSTSTTCSSAV